ncbi:MAG: hypothetical protein RL161_760 [Bacteroidota bacterium]
MKGPTSKFFLALIPPEPIYGEAMTFKELVRDQYHSKGALRSPAHITLHMPFDWPDHKAETLFQELTAYARKLSPVDLTLKDFGCFEPRVIFIAVEPSADLLHLQKEFDRFFKIKFNLFNASYQDLPYHPHLTVAFRDLKKSEFYRAWEMFKEKKFNGHFTAHSVTLLKHDGQKWQSHLDFKLGNA